MPTPSKWVWTATGSAEVVAGAPDRIVDRVAVRDPRRAGEEDAGDLVARAEPADLGRRGLGMLRRDDEQPAQARLRLEPLGQQPVVVAAAQAGGEQRVGQDAKAAASSGVRIPTVTSNGSRTFVAHAVERLADELGTLGGRLAVVGVRAQPAGGVVPGVGRHARARSCPTRRPARPSRRRGRGADRAASGSRRGCRNRRACDPRYDSSSLTI